MHQVDTRPRLDNVLEVEVLLLHHLQTDTKMGGHLMVAVAPTVVAHLGMARRLHHAMAMEDLPEM